MSRYQNIHREIETVEYLNRFVVVSVHDMVVKIDAQIRAGIASMKESGIPTEACKEFSQKHYEETNKHLFQGICDTIIDKHIRIIKQYLVDLANQYFHATGTSIDIRGLLVYPDSSLSANATTPLTTRNNGVNDYRVQCAAVCDFTDFLVQQTEELNAVLQGYGNCCNGLLSCGVPKQICDNYVENYAKPLYKAIDNNLRAALIDAYQYLIKVYNSIVASMRNIGLSVARAPRELSTSCYGGESRAAAAMTTGNVVQAPHGPGDKAEQAKEQNIRDLEHYLGTKRGPEMRIAQADKQNANPHYWEGQEYRVNCATCTLAYVLRHCFGFNVKARGNNKKSESLNYWLSNVDKQGANCFKIWKNADGTPAQPTSMMDWMEQNGIREMTAENYRSCFDDICKEKGVYILTLCWKKEFGGGGHATILERDEDGHLYHIEPQYYDEEQSDKDGRRQVDDLVHDLAPDPQHCHGILRVDDKLLDVDEKSFFLYDDIYRIIKPIPLQQVSDDYKSSMGKVIKMRFTDLVEI